MKVRAGNGKAGTWITSPPLLRHEAMMPPLAHQRADLLHRRGAAQCYSQWK
jgi:hypothetical protein